MLRLWAMGKGPWPSLASLLAVHRGVTAATAAGWDDAVLPEAEVQLRRLRSIWAELPPPPMRREQMLDREIRMLVDLKDSGRLDAALGLVAAVVPPLGPPGDPAGARLWLEVAEVQRFGYRWREASTSLDEAATWAAAAPAADRPMLEARIAIARAVVEVSRGRPDLAEAFADRAAAAADVLRHEGGDATAAFELAVDATFTRLRLDHVLDRPDEAMAAMAAFEATPSPAGMAAADLAHELAKLHNRAALAVFADPAAAGPAVATVAGWLEGIDADVQIGADERALARTTLARRRLDEGRLEDAAGLLQRFEADWPVDRARISERRLVFAELCVRLSLLRGVSAQALRPLVDELAGCWDAMLQQLGTQPVHAAGLGPLALDYRRRALVTLARGAAAVAADGGPGAATAFALLARTEAHGSMARALQLPAPPLDEVQRQLCAGDRALLLLLPGYDRGLAVVVRRDRSMQVELAAAGVDIERRRRRAVAGLQRWRAGAGPRADAEAAWIALAEVLLPPEVRAAIRGAPALAIVGGDVLGYVPFELLPDDDGQPLGCTRRVAYLPSLSVGTWLASRPVAPPATARVVLAACVDAAAHPELAAAAPPLPFGPDESAALARAVSPAVLDLRRGEAAGWRALQAQLPGAAMLQLLAHGVRDERRIDPQGILLGDGAALWPLDLDGAALPPWVLVTACRAARGRERRGDDGRHLLAGAALLAGARAVVAPQLDVGYRDTLAFAAALHRELWSGGVPLDEALRRARCAMRAADGDGVDALLFHLVGLGDAPLVAPTAAADVDATDAGSGTGTGRWVVAALLLAGAALAAWVLRRRGG